MPKGAQYLPDKCNYKLDKGIRLEIKQCHLCGLIQLNNDAVQNTPISINEIIRSDERKNRGHFISILFDCKIINGLRKDLKYTKGDPIHGVLKWHNKSSDKLIPVHKMNERIIERKTTEKYYQTDFGITRVIL